MVTSFPVRLFLVIFEAIQVVASLADVGLDMLVCYEFYRKGHRIPFYASLSVFIIAQAAYAFLFSATYARKIRTSWGKCRAFLIALPLAQLVPLFNWLETFHFKLVDEFLRSLGLEPTGTTYVEDDDARVPVAGSNGSSSSGCEDNNLWSFALNKFRANLGFLVEAIVEAIPQAMIQTCVVVMYGEADVLIVVSILMSVFVVASKGYMLSYSIHPETFLFNALCVVADVCGLFAAIVWAIAGCSASSLASPDPSLLNLAWMYSGMIGILLLWVGGFCLESFANADDHLKLSWEAKGRGITLRTLPTNSVLFDLYVIRNVTWFLALIPSAVLLLAFKVSSIPLLVLNSFQPAHSSFPQVCRRVFDYIHRGGPQQASKRLFHLNQLLLLAKIDATSYQYTVEPIYRIAAVNRSPAGKIALRNYVALLGRNNFRRHWSKRVTNNNQSMTDQNTNGGTTSVGNNHSTISIEELHRRQVRMENHRNSRDRDLSEFEQRSVIWWFLNGGHLDAGRLRRGDRKARGLDLGDLDVMDDDDNDDDDLDIDKEYRNEYTEQRKRWCGRQMSLWRECTWKQRALLATGIVFFGAFVLMMLVFAPVFAVLSVVGTLIPIVGPIQWFFSRLDEDPLALPTAMSTSSLWSLEIMLGLILSSVQMLCLGLILLLLPKVHQFQSSVKDLVDFSDHPVLGDDAFYKAGLDAILEEAFRRYREQLGRDELIGFLETKTDVDAAKRIRMFLTGQEGF